MEQALNVYAAAQLLGTSPTGLYKLVRRRRIPFRRSGRRLIFLRGELERFLRELPGLTLEALETREMHCIQPKGTPVATNAQESQ